MGLIQSYYATAWPGAVPGFETPGLKSATPLRVEDVAMQSKVRIPIPHFHSIVATRRGRCQLDPGVETPG
ncbi:MAG TPA: hypothetical protein VI750_01650 [Pyrinomonadaceae bacterium]|nr:hypothetical protein [Pyrinomonadaceae bacterium]